MASSALSPAAGPCAMGGRRTGLVKSTADFGKSTAVTADPTKDLLDNSLLFGDWLKSRSAATLADRNVAISERSP
jgi:hypothetical protein